MELLLGLAEYRDLVQMKTPRESLHDEPGVGGGQALVSWRHVTMDCNLNFSRRLSVFHKDCTDGPVQTVDSNAKRHAS